MHAYEAGASQHAASLGPARSLQTDLRIVISVQSTAGDSLADSFDGEQPLSGDGPLQGLLADGDTSARYVKVVVYEARGLKIADVGGFSDP